MFAEFIIIATALSYDSAMADDKQIDQQLLIQFQAGAAQIPKFRKTVSLHMKTTTKRVVSEETIIDSLKHDYHPEYLKQLRAKGIDPRKYVRDVNSRTISNELALKDGSLLLIQDRPDKRNVVAARNQDYLFTISRLPDSKVYSIDWLSKVGEPLDPAARKILNYKVEAVNTLALSAWSFYGQPLEELVSSNGFKVNAIREITVDGTKLVRVDFERQEKKFRHAGTVTDAYLICDPSKQWALVEYAATLYNYKGKPFMRSKMTHDLSEFAPGTPFVRKVVNIRQWLDNPKRIDTAESVRELVNTDPDDEIFYLSGYGLPEPKFESSFPTWLTYALAGLACLAVVYFWRRRSAMRE